MLKPNPNPVFRNRKGIYTHLDASQSLVCDERWQFVAIGGDYIEFDNEATRPAPFPEPRQDAVTWTLRLATDGAWKPDTLAIHASAGKREARVNWSSQEAGEMASFCWQHGKDLRRAERRWPPPTALGFKSGFFMTALLHEMPPGETGSFDVIWMNTLSFAPQAAIVQVVRRGRGVRPTHFGPRVLEGFCLACDFPGDAEAHSLLNGQVWRDETDLVHEWLGTDGDAIWLTAVN
ncbi:MAG: hypothetical protein ABIQ99_17415 [Thermoflexales bacterium]